MYIPNAFAWSLSIFVCLQIAFVSFYKSFACFQNKYACFKNAMVYFQKTCGALCDLVPFVQFKKREKHPWKSVNFSKVAGFRLLECLCMLSKDILILSRNIYILSVYICILF